MDPGNRMELTADRPERLRFVAIDADVCAIRLECSARETVLFQATGV